MVAECSDTTSFTRRFWRARRRKAVSATEDRHGNLIYKYKTHSEVTNCFMFSFTLSPLYEVVQKKCDKMASYGRLHFSVD